MVFGHETYKWPKKKGKKLNPWPPESKSKPKEQKFIVTPYEHERFKDWYNDLNTELRALLEQKGMPTEEFLEKLWVSGFRDGYKSAPQGEMRIGPPSVG